MANQSILIVEDEAILAAHLQDLLSALGYCVPTPVATGEEALAAAAAHPPDLVLMDIELAGQINGIAAAEEIRRVRNVPIVFLTAYAQDPLLQQAKAAAPYGYLIKPVSERELAATLEMALYRHALDCQLKASEEYTQSIIDSMADMLVVISPDGNIATVNEATCQSLGYLERELIGKPATLLFVEDDSYESTSPQRPLVVKRTLLRRLLKEGALRNVEKSLRTKGGVRVPVLISGSVMRDDAGAIRGIVCLALDITERKQVEERLREAAQLRAEAEKLAATGRMAAQVAHEINNPLAGIKNAFRLIKDAVPEDHPDRDMVGRIEREIDRIARVVRQMYQIYSPGALKQSDIPVGETICDVLMLLEPLCREHEVTVEMESVPSELTVWARDGSLQQILYNLTANAIHASHNGGAVNISANNVDEDYVRISIRDQGHGISAELHDRIFEPFFSGDANDSAKQGLGLGLTIVKSIVGSVGGRIELQSTVGKGASFHVYLPSKQI